MGYVARILKAQPANAIRTLQQRKGMYSPTVTFKSDDYRSDDADGGQRHVSFESALRELDDDQVGADVPIIGNNPASRRTHAWLTGDVVFAFTQIDANACNSPVGDGPAGAPSDMWWAAMTTSPLPQDQATHKKQIVLLWLDKSSAPDASSGDYVLTTQRDEVYYGSILRDPAGIPIVAPVADLNSQRRRGQNVVTFDPDFLDYLDERCEAHENNYAADIRIQHAERGGDANDEGSGSEGDEEQVEDDLTPEDAIATTTRSGRVSRPPTDAYLSRLENELS